MLALHFVQSVYYQLLQYGHVYTKQVKQSHICTFRGAKVNENTEN